MRRALALLAAMLVAVAPLPALASGTFYQQAIGCFAISPAGRLDNLYEGSCPRTLAPDTAQSATFCFAFVNGEMTAASLGACSASAPIATTRSWNAFVSAASKTMCLSQDSVTYAVTALSLGFCP